jgi:hypothetical protein
MFWLLWVDESIGEIDANGVMGTGEYARTWVIVKNFVTEDLHDPTNAE